jgi:N-acyl-D-aspartate/D-glutamate deacylase
MTGLTAQRFGLADRRLVAPVMAADLGIFDADRVLDQLGCDEPRTARARHRSGHRQWSGRMAPRRGRALAGRLPPRA